GSLEPLFWAVHRIQPVWDGVASLDQRADFALSGRTLGLQHAFAARPAATSDSAQLQLTKSDVRLAGVSSRRHGVQVSHLPARLSTVSCSGGQCLWAPDN